VPSSAALRAERHVVLPSPGEVIDLRRVLRSRGEPLVVPGQKDGVEPARIGQKARSPSLPGSFPPPPRTLCLSVDRQPNGFTCGPMTYEGIADFLRLPLRDPDHGVEEHQKEMGTSYKYGTEPYAIANAAREHLGIEAKVEKGMTIRALAGLVNDTQRYVDSLLKGAEPTKPLHLVMITYQAYMDTRKRSIFEVDGEKVNLSVRSKDGRILWQNDYDDGHYSAVTRIVLPTEKNTIRWMAQRAMKLGYEQLEDGVAILADPSNGLDLSFMPLPELDARWQDSNRQNEPVFPHTAIVFTVPVEKLKQMQKAAEKAGHPMFSLKSHNAVSYVP
jgi:hypothetical protein